MVGSWIDSYVNRTTLVRRLGAVVDFRNSRWLSLDSDTPEWTQIPRDEKGHLLIDVLGGFPSREEEQVYKEEEEHDIGSKQERIESDSSTEKSSDDTESSH